MKERWVELNTNHAISKSMETLSFNIITLEELESAEIRKKSKGKAFNRRPGSWLPYQLA
ncbi:hypothetical protein [Ferroplasma sp.]|uniref:hypothetical protein n=1 Tax=Ferroplasma sp. TaxID=2591003 RepID=UPI00307F808B